MNLSELCIKRPVFTIAMTMVLIIAGAVLFHRLTVRELPKIARPIISIRTDYSGADAKLVENEITTPLEDALSTVNGIDYMTSDSQQGVSRIQVHFKTGYDINIGMTDIRDSIAAKINHLPKDVSQPRLRKADSDSDPAIIVSVNDKRRSAEDLTDYAKRYIVPSLEQVEGVNNINIWGQRRYAMRIWLHPQKMAAQHIAINDITDALLAQNSNIPGGRIQGATRDYSLLASANIQTVKQFSDLVVNARQGFITHFRNIADIKVAPENIDSAFRIDGKSALALAIVPTSTANPVDVAAGVRHALKGLQQSLPSNMQVDVLYSQATFIKASIEQVYHTIIEALLLVSFVVLLFLGSWRSTAVPIATIPICLIASFTLLFLFNYSINTITLLAMVLAIGLVVDDAIVMLENIHRHMEMGKSRWQAAIAGSKEITFAVIAMTLTLVAVYLPIGFVDGLTGTIFRQFALTLAGAVLISGFIALSLSPMMSSRILVAHNKAGRYQQWVEKGMQSLMNVYSRGLRYCLGHRYLLLGILLLLWGLGFLVLQNTASELAPQEDQSSIKVHVRAPTNASFAYTDSYARQIEKVFNSIPEIKNYMVITGNGGRTDSAYARANLLAWNERNHSQAQVTAVMQKQLNRIPGVNAVAARPPALGQSGGSSSGVEFKLVSAMDFNRLHAIGDNIVALLSRYPGLHNVRNQLQLNNEQFDVQIKRNLAADLHVKISDITDAIKTYIGQQQVTNFEYDGEIYDVLLQLPRQQRQDLQSLKTIYLRNADGNMIPLANLVTIKPMVGPLSLPHYNRLRTDNLTAEIAAGYTIGDVVNYLQTVGKTQLPTGVSYAFAGSAKRFLEAKGNMLLIFLLALAFIYLVLAAQFESFIDPFIVMLTVPLSLIGGLLVLNITHGSLNVFSQIALVTLIGLITKHGILMVDFANQQRANGFDKFTAMVQAAALRLRPILMTTAAMVLGALPLALASGPGSEPRQQIGWVIVGGMLIGTFFSLFIIPVAYVSLSRHG